MKTFAISPSPLKKYFKIESLCTTHMKGDEFRTQTPNRPPQRGLKRTPMSLRILVLEMCKQLVALPPDPQGIFNTLGLFCIKL